MLTQTARPCPTVDCAPHRSAFRGKKAGRRPQHRLPGAIGASEGVHLPHIEMDLSKPLIQEETMSGDVVKEEGGEVIYVEPGFEAAEGGRLGEDYVIGKMLGGGFQGAVFSLEHSDKSKPECKQLLKVVRAKYAKPITGADTGLKREWIIGQALNKLKTSKGDNAPGFMGTGAAVVQKGNDVLEGLVLQKVNGMPLDKRLWKDDTFADAPYTLEMLKQVFLALKRADRELGLMHNDCRVANIMEDRPDSNDLYLPKGFKKNSRADRKRLREMQKGDKPKEQAAKEKGKGPKFMLPGDDKPRELQFKIIDYGHAILPKHPRLPEPPIAEYFYRRMFYGKHDAWRLLQDLSDAIDGRTWPARDKSTVELIHRACRAVTGVQLNAYYSGPGAPKPSGLGRVAAFLWRSSKSPLHNLRRQFIKFKAYVKPALPQASAAEVLALLNGDEGPLEAHRKSEQERLWNKFQGGRTL